jgi:hypothetical protein
VPLPRVIGREPRDLHAALYEAATGAEQKAPVADAMRLVLAAVLGQLESIDVSINEIRGKGGQVQLVRTITGVGKTDLPPGSTIVFSDAAASVEDYQVILGPGRPVHDITPRGAPERWNSCTNCPTKSRYLFVGGAPAEGDTFTCLIAPNGFPENDISNRMDLPV